MSHLGADIYFLPITWCFSLPKGSVLKTKGTVGLLIYEEHKSSQLFCNWTNCIFFQPSKPSIQVVDWVDRMTFLSQVQSKFEEYGAILPCRSSTVREFRKFCETSFGGFLETKMLLQSRQTKISHNTWSNSTNPQLLGRQASYVI